MCIRDSGYIDQLDDELIRISKESFDALSFNCYALSPDHEKMNHALEISGLPMIIGEYHFGQSTEDSHNPYGKWTHKKKEEMLFGIIPKTPLLTEGSSVQAGSDGSIRTSTDAPTGRITIAVLSTLPTGPIPIWSMRLSKQPNRYMKYIPVQKHLSIKRLTPWDTLPYPISGNK